MQDSDKGFILMKEGGLQCSQAVVAVLGERLGIDTKLAIRLASGFGGGIALQGDICGAISGAIMAIGLKHGYENGPNIDARDKVFFFAQELIDRIKVKYGAYTCKALTGIDFRKPEEYKRFYEQNISSIICKNIVKDTIQVVEEIW